jgi:hypothetical protein
MAETKAAAKKRKSGSPQSKSRAGATSSKAKKARPTPKPRKRPASKPASTNGSKASGGDSASSKPRAALKAVEETTKDAGGKVANIAGKAKVPLLASGAAVAGVAGGIALGARQAHHKSRIGSVSSRDLAKAAKKVGEVGAQVGEVALEVRRARETTNGKVHRSPIEVVLQGLTQRRPRG